MLMLFAHCTLKSTQDLLADQLGQADGCKANEGNHGTNSRVNFIVPVQDEDHEPLDETSVPCLADHRHGLRADIETRILLHEPEQFVVVSAHYSRLSRSLRPID